MRFIRPILLLLLSVSCSDPAVMSMSLGADTLPEYRMKKTTKAACVILHFSLFKAIWDWIIIILVMYTAIVTPYMAAFSLTRESAKEQKDLQSHILKSSNPLIIIEFIVDIMFIIDILIHFRTSYENKDNEIETDPCNMAKHYMTRWFIIDLLGAIPFELIIMFGNTDQNSMIISLLKSARLLRVGRVALKLDRYSEYGTVLIVFLMGGFALFGHWLACAWYAIGIVDEGNEAAGNWLYKLGEDLNMPYNRSDVNSGPGSKESYLTALYFIFTCVTSVGFGNVSANTNNEKAFTIVIMLIGALKHAVIFGNVTAIINRLYSNMAQYHSKMRKVREFIRLYQIPSPLSKRLKDYAQYDYAYTNGIDMKEVLQNFSSGIQAEICLHLTRNLLQSITAFKKSSRGCRRSLALKLNTTHASEGDYIIVPGDVIGNLYWIRRGVVQIILDGGVVAQLSKGESFGENFGLTENLPTGKSKASVRAATYCDFHSISRADLLDIMRAYPEFRKSFNNDLEITYELRDDEPEDKVFLSMSDIHNSYLPSPYNTTRETNCRNTTGETNYRNTTSETNYHNNNNNTRHPVKRKESIQSINGESTSPLYFVNNENISPSYPVNKEDKSPSYRANTENTTPSYPTNNRDKDVTYSVNKRDITSSYSENEGETSPLRPLNDVTPPSINNGKTPPSFYVNNVDISPPIKNDKLSPPNQSTNQSTKQTDHCALCDCMDLHDDVMEIKTRLSNLELFMDENMKAVIKLLESTESKETPMKDRAASLSSANRLSRIPIAVFDNDDDFSGVETSTL